MSDIRKTMTSEQLIAKLKAEIKQQAAEITRLEGLLETKLNHKENES